MLSHLRRIKLANTHFVHVKTYIREEKRHKSERERNREPCLPVSRRRRERKRRCSWSTVRVWMALKRSFSERFVALLLRYLRFLRSYFISIFTHHSHSDLPLSLNNILCICFLIISFILLWMLSSCIVLSLEWQSERLNRNRKNHCLLQNFSAFCSCVIVTCPSMHDNVIISVR